MRVPRSIADRFIVTEQRGATPAVAVGKCGGDHGRVTVKTVGLGMYVGEQWLFQDLDLRVEAGECLVLAGRNGSGKSTVLHLLYGLRAPAAGTIEVAGHTPDERDVRFRQKVAVLLDDSELFVELSPRQHLELLLGTFDADLTDVDGWLAHAGLAERADVHAYYLSAGQRRRLLLLGAIARPHDVLLLDEPERALDHQGKTWLEEVVQQERDLGRTVVIATHHPPLTDVADHVVRLG
jgi:ABC-2 type transport system ATP-binding protein